MSEGPNWEPKGPAPREDGWRRTEKKMDKGPVHTMIALALLLAAGIAIFGSVGLVFGWFGEAASVAREEFGPRAAMQKYEWFKKTAGELSKKQADIAIYEGRVTQMEKDYEGTKRKDWDRVDKQQMTLWQSEVAGVKASFNGLAAEYNARSQMFNWSAFDTSEHGELPRTFKAYVSR